MSRPRLLDFAMLLSLSLMWGSAFLFIELALVSFEPVSLAAIRITIGAVFLWVFALLNGHRLPTDRRDWGRIAAIGFIGLVLPFILIGWAQQGIESSNAAIIMAFTPLTTLLMAHIMTRDEKLTPGKTAGLVLGFAGVFLLLGGAGGGAGGAAGGGAGLGGLPDTWPRQLAVLLATLGYALSSIIMRNLSHITPTSASAGVMIAASVMIIPLALVFGSGPTSPVTILSGGSIIFLGILPSALATVVMIHLINRVGVTFMAMNSYLVPAIGVIWGALLLEEKITPHAGGAFALILAGVALASFTTKRRLSKES